MAAEHLSDIRKVQPHGPYFIGGGCSGGGVALEISYAGSRAPTERKLTEIWSTELAMDMVGITDKYEDRGGDSLLAASIFARIETTFGVHIPMYSLLDAPNLEQLARQIDRLCQDGG